MPDEFFFCNFPHHCTICLPFACVTFAPRSVSLDAIPLSFSSPPPKKKGKSKIAELLVPMLPFLVGWKAVAGVEHRIVLLPVDYCRCLFSSVTIVEHAFCASLQDCFG